MSFLLGSAFHFFSRPPSADHPGDRLYHILVSPAEVEKTPAFYYLPRRERHFEATGIDGVFRQLSSADIHIELAELSCLSLRDLLTFGDGNDYETICQRAQEEIRHHQTLRAQNEELRRQVGMPTQFLLGRSRGMRQVWEQIQACADLDIVTLILGETGVGKELVAREIHTHSSRRNGPFHPINCGAFPENLLEAELFGSTKGAYTGADKERIGAFRSARGGTLFLDEIGEMSPKGQAALLRALQDRRVRPVGGDQEVDIGDVKVITATNRDLNEMIEEQAFRQDLYYRISGYPIAVPPLRLRQEDIPLLVEHFFRQYNQKHQREVVGLVEEAMESLRGYSWPGNVRELAHVVERLVIHARRGAVNIRPEDLPLEIRKPAENQRLLLDQALEKPLKEGRELFDKLRITRALAQSGGSVPLAAMALGLTRQGLAKAIKNLGLAST
jgi:two-component system response regulator HydG